MDPGSLIGPTSALPYPAPYWFLSLFKVLGFTLHMVPMNLWYAGIPLALLLHWRGGPQGRAVSRRLMKQMPIIIAFGINLGIVPLLFTQVAYNRIFYPATILTAWPWFSVILLLVVAYYGVYIYVSGLRSNPQGMAPWRRAAGWVSALLFIVIGFLFANAMSLMANIEAWPGLWEQTSVAGAPLGTALNTGDATLWPRWLMMLGLALTTTAAYLVVDAAFFAGKETDDYRQWARGLALKVYSAGLAGFAVFGAWYVFGTWPSDLVQRMLDWPWLPLTVGTAVVPGLPWLFVIAHRLRPSRWMAGAVALGQVGVLGLNAVTRQAVQNIELEPFLDVTAESVATQWSPLVVFLLLFVAGVGVMAWMVRQVVAAERQPTMPPG